MSSLYQNPSKKDMHVLKPLKNHVTFYWKEGYIAILDTKVKITADNLFRLFKKTKCTYFKFTLFKVKDHLFKL